MKAIGYSEYGGPEVLRTEDLPLPSPGPGQVRVRVHATSVNAADYRLMRANPFLVRLTNGLFRPQKWKVLGSDVAGVVEALGEGVEHLEVGERVFGSASQDGLGAFAEQVIVRESSLLPLPEGVPFEEAAAIPLAAITALQALTNAGGLERGDSVLIQGAGGGVGIFAAQIALALGAKVTAVCGPKTVPILTALGVNRVIDYQRVDFAEEDRRYDLILGVNGYRSLGTYCDALKPGGHYVCVGGTSRQIFGSLLFGKLKFLFSGKSVTTLTLDDSQRANSLATLQTLLSRGKLRPVIDRTFALDEVPEAVRYVELGHVRGKVIIQVAA